MVGAAALWHQQQILGGVGQQQQIHFGQYGHVGQRLPSSSVGGGGAGGGGGGAAAGSERHNSAGNLAEHASAQLLPADLSWQQDPAVDLLFR